MLDRSTAAIPPIESRVSPSLPLSRSLRYRAEALAARGLLAGLGRMDLDTVSALGGRLGRIVGPRLTRRQALARRNLSLALPEVDADAVLAAMWDNLGRTFFEIAKMRGLEDGKGAGVVEIRGAEHLRAALAEGRGAIGFSAHLGNWEVLAVAPALLDFDAAMMYRKPNNPAVHEMLNALRPARVTFLEKDRAGTLGAFATLKAGGCVGLLVDHRYNKGVEVDFFGRPARVAPTAALMARKTACPLLPLRVERLDGARFRMTIEPPLAVDRDLPPDAFAQTVMQAAMNRVECWIRERPAQWFWVQRLWAD